MPEKLLVIILSAALTAAGLLVARQRRLETAGAMSRIHAQITRHERTLWELRCDIARRCRPEDIRRMMEEMPEEWTAVPDPRTRPVDGDVEPADVPPDLPPGTVAGVGGEDGGLDGG